MTTESLRRYTSLPILLDILNTKSLTLLDPSSWEDINDSYFIELYKDKLKFKSVLALCFTDGRETYHHWKIFSGTPSGVCIVFNKNNLRSNFNSIDGIRMEYVIYKFVQDLKKKNNLDISQFPFLKRMAFKDDNEFRIIYTSCSEKNISKKFSININSISRIIFNPWIPEPVFESVQAVIKKIDGCNQIKIGKTDLINNEQWKKIGKNIVDTHMTTSDRNYPNNSAK